ncbi:MAG: glutamate 5-kinase [Acidobacteriota bacterium]
MNRVSKRDRSRAELLAAVRRVVVKIGSGVLTRGGVKLEPRVIGRLARELCALKSKGRELVLVSSGAIVAGSDRLGLKRRPADLAGKQAAAAVGQTHLIWMYERAFARHAQRVAQILITREDLADRRRFLNARHTLFELLRLDAIPIINENDSVAVEEIQLGDNDQLSALVTNLVEADLLVILTDTDGLYERDPRLHPEARLLGTVPADGIPVGAGGPSGLGVGGMRTKVLAAQQAAAYGVPTIIASGHRSGLIEGLLNGDPIGTLVRPRERALGSRKHWIAYTLRPAGRIVVDSGAERAIVHGGKSLLPSGVRGLRGSFEVGGCVEIAAEGGREFARGMVSYSSSELERIKGLKSSEIERALGYHSGDEVVHRNDLVLLSAVESTA